MTGTDVANGEPADGDVLVLLVDDDGPWAASTAAVLEHQREAFVVETATDLGVARDAVRSSDPDCIVCDYDLEAGTGLDLLSTVREGGDDRPFILITGQGSESVASDAIGREVTDYIPKRSLGGREDLLARRIESAVEAWRTERALLRERRSKEAMLDIVTATSSQEGVAREFCEHLVAERGYACAWIGTAGRPGEVVPRAAAGAESYVDAVVEPGTTPGERTEPALSALRRREACVVAPLSEDAGDEDSEDAGDEEWRRVAADHGFESAAAVPIEHEETTFGVLAVYASEPAFDPGERELLAEYGETIGYALRSAEWKASLLSTTPVRVAVEVGDGAAPLVALGRGLPADARLEALTTVPRAAALLYVLRVDGAEPTALREAAGAIEAVESVAVSGEEPPFRCELLVSLPTPESVIADHGGRVVDLTVEGTRARITVVSGSQDEVGALIEAVRAEYADVGIRSVRSRTTGTTEATGDPFQSLTDKQRRAIEVAFYSGYFQRPREHDATEVAEKLGVSRQTLAQHLRAAERKLLEELLDA